MLLDFWDELFKSPFCDSVVVNSGVVEVTSGVVEVTLGVVEVTSVVVDVVSSMQRLSPETQSSQDSSIVGQFWNRMHSDPKG
jgi:hypothetical protein